MGYSRQLCKPGDKVISARKANILTSQPCLHTLMQTRLSANSERAYYLSCSTFTDIFSYVFIWHLASGSGDLNPRILVAVQKDRGLWERGWG